ncbi:MAG TPA: phosphatase PAP2 family protein [Polyangiaceae bacterium]
MRERARRVTTAARLLLKDLLRRRIAVLLLFVVPALFDAVVLATTASRSIRVTLGTLADAVEPTGIAAFDRLGSLFLDAGVRTVDERRLSLVFLGTAAVSFLACFLAFNLAHRRREADARLVHAGYRAHEVLLAKLIVLVGLVLLLAIYETAILSPWVAPRQVGLVVAGLFFGGIIYGCLGMLVGALVKQELEGIFLIVLLTNIDAGWLQNPIYYAHSQRQGLIRSLPGYAPVQLAVVGALTGDAPHGTLSRALVWTAVALAAALFAFGARIRPARPERARLRWHYANVLVVAYAIWFGAFELVGRWAATLHTVDLTSAWDRAVPLVPAFVWPYEATYVLPLLSLVVMRDWHRFNVALVAFVIANLTAFVLYVLVPIAYARPELGSSLAERVLAMEYAADFHPGANKLPSMHVAMSWIMVCAMWGQAKNRLVDAGLAILLALITVAPIFVKQHLIIDVVAGVPWGLGSYWVAERAYRRLVAKDATALEGLARVFWFRRFG